MYVKTKEDKNNKNTTSKRIWLENANKLGIFKPETDGASQTHISRVSKSNFWWKISWKQRRIKVLRTLLQKGLDWKMRTRWETFSKPKTDGASQPHISRVNCTLHQHLSKILSEVALLVVLTSFVFTRFFSKNSC